MNRGLEGLNLLAPAAAQAELRKCCGSSLWAERMTRARPFRDLADLQQAADRTWRELSREDWLEAFGCHPKIGGKKPAAAESRRWSEEEQLGTRSAGEDVLAALEESNRAYEQRFGYIYIVCATGKSSEEMLALLRQRLQNDPDTELAIGAEEQRKITRIRLEKLLRDLEA